ncbi:MAG TPA: DUF3090 family protein [Candidatus Dormibacteraeota bacterium]|jgi:uncharacterized repeat protein (TIGR03847 family)|nr:DUF3090 family protein [Candidatus Dormibacteraeota bacterium]
MAEDIEIDPAESVAVGTVGPPGQRAFYIQARSMYRTLTMLVEKVQVQALAERAVEMLQGQELGPEEKPAELQEPVQPDWRAAQLGLGVDEERKMIVLVAQEAPEDEDAEEDAVATARVWMRPEQALALSARGLELVAKGRPLCPICGLPMDPEGHLCPRKNGKSPVF